MSANDGGPAFPVPIVPHQEDWMTGMTLRDYFASKAMPNYLGIGDAQTRARACYAEADAMIAARGCVK